MEEWIQDPSLQEFQLKQITLEIISLFKDLLEKGDTQYLLQGMNLNKEWTKLVEDNMPQILETSIIESKWTEEKEITTSNVMINNATSSSSSNYNSNQQITELEAVAIIMLATNSNSPANTIKLSMKTTVAWCSNNNSKPWTLKSWVIIQKMVLLTICLMLEKKDLEIQASLAILRQLLEPTKVSKGEMTRLAQITTLKSWDISWKRLNLGLSQVKILQLRNFLSSQELAPMRALAQIKKEDL